MPRSTSIGFIFAWVLGAPMLHAQSLDQKTVPIAPPAADGKVNPVLVKNAQGVFLDCGPGLKAQLVVNNRPGLPYKASLQLADTTCNHFSGDMTCSLDIDLRANKADFIWIQNPDPSRLNKGFTYRKSTSTPFIGLPVQSQLESFYAPSRKTRAAGLGPDVLTCPNYDWMPAYAQKDPFITAWYSSTMITNTETNVAENRATDALIGIQLKKSGKSFVVSQFEEVQTRNLFLIHPFISPQQTMIFTDPSGGASCQVNWTFQVPPSETERFITESARPIDQPIPVQSLENPLFSFLELQTAAILKDGVFVQ